MENININWKKVEQVGNYLLYADMQLKDRKKFNQDLDEYERVKSQVMPCPPFGWDENIASSDAFCKITTSDIILFPNSKKSTIVKPLILNSHEEIKLHFLKGSIWQKQLIWDGSINLLAGLFDEFLLRSVFKDKVNIHDRVHRHFINSSIGEISADVLANQKALGRNDKTAEIIKIIMKNILK